MVAAVSPTSMMVSWKGIDHKILQFMDYSLYGYTIYYRQKKNESVTVLINSSDNMVVIEDLIANTVYKFQVAAIIDFSGKLITGVRSAVVEAHIYVCKLLYKN